jgi:hypothetical protein
MSDNLVIISSKEHAKVSSRHKLNKKLDDRFGLIVQKISKKFIKKLKIQK